LRKGKQKDL
jgi:hypothetical protein